MEPLISLFSNTQFSNGEYIGKEDLSRIDRESRNIAVTAFEEKTQRFPQIIVREYKEKLNEHMDQSLQRFEDTNQVRKYFKEVMYC